MTVEEAGNILYQIDPAMNVTSVMASPVSGLWEIVFENNGKKGMLYIPYSKKHVIAGVVVEIATGTFDVRSMKQGIE
jgi:thiol:disulfide interchange protein DsbC